MSTKPFYANYQTLSPPAAGDPELIDEGYERKTYLQIVFPWPPAFFSPFRTLADVDFVMTHAWPMYSN